MHKSFPEHIYAAGMTDLVSVIPPGAKLLPSSTIAASMVGKVPGRRLENGLWAGYNWRAHTATAEDVRRWALEGASVGVRAARFPAIDIDCTDEALAKIITQHAIATLGPAPMRIGRAPKRLLIYRAIEPFGRLRLWIKRGAEDHLVEVLGDGQQYLVHGTHPGTHRPYTWHADHGLDMAALESVDQLTPLTLEQANAFLDSLADVLDAVGVGQMTREGDGKRTSTPAAAQHELAAPSLDILRDAVRRIPNDNTLFPARHDYLRMGYAIRAAGQADLDEAYAIFSEWAGKWSGNDRTAANDPEVVHADWRRMKGPYSVGWSYLAEMARPHGFNDAALEFEVEQPAPEEAVDPAPMYSDQWLADKVVLRQRGRLRYVPEQQRWLVWDNARWVPDVGLLAQDVCKHELRRVANAVRLHGASPKEQTASEKIAVAICASAKVPSVLSLVQSDRAVAVPVTALDHDAWTLNTPAGLIDLRIGALRPADPDALCTRQTAVPADFAGECPQWRQFLRDATGGDTSLQLYLQRLAGYCLTGSTREQQLTFIWGDGGNGKSIFLNVLAGILGDYSRVSSMDTFTASYGDKHSADIAMLAGARLVAASETGAGKRWDEARVKSLTGGEPVSARFMRQDFFTFLPSFKLVFVGNHKPEIRDIDAAMRRRIQMVPFTHKPRVIDKELAAKLRQEWPAILAWAVEGCLRWQQDGLAPPPAVLAETEAYFAGEDVIGRFIEECCDVSAEYASLSQDLWVVWLEWAHTNRERSQTMKWFGGQMMTRFTPWRHPVHRRKGYVGVQPKPEFANLTIST